MKSITRSKEDRGKIIILAIQARSKMKGCMDLKDKDITCTNCSKSGHEATSCF